MISIIISSYQKNFFDALVQNIEDTCGIVYEIIKIDNPALMGISEAYNKGAQKAQYPYLVFCHEDILFHTQNWGTQLIKQLSIENIGIIGLVGSNYVPKSPCGWYIPNAEPLERNPTISEKENAIVLDGMFLALRKKVYQKNHFGEYLEDFHGYDIDLCLQVAKKYQNIQLNTIKIDHFSSGNTNHKYFEAIINVRNKRGYQFGGNSNDAYEYNCHLAFVKTYFKYYSVNFENFKFILKYLPKFKKTKFYLKTFKTYFSIWKHRKTIILNN